MKLYHLVGEEMHVSENWSNSGVRSHLRWFGKSLIFGAIVGSTHSWSFGGGRRFPYSHILIGHEI